MAKSGIAPPHPRTVLHGDILKPSFVEFQCEDEHCPSLVSVNVSDKVVLFAQALRMGTRVTPGEIAQPHFFERLEQRSLKTPNYIIACGGKAANSSEAIPKLHH